MSFGIEYIVQKYEAVRLLAFSSGDGSRRKMAIINTSVGFISLVIPIFLQFISRRVFLDYLNVEYLGINGTLGALLSALSLSELGIQTAVVYCLYKPLAEHDYVMVNKLMNVLRVIYKWIGCIFIIFPFVFSPFLRFVLKGTDIDYIILLSFFIISFTSACSYFLAYKRCLIFADQKEYVSKLIDFFCNIVFTVIQIVTLVLFHSFLIFTIVSLLSVIISNLIIHKFCRILYPFLCQVPFSREVFKEVWSYTKNIIILRLAAYVYTSTDNIVISSMIGATWVGLLGNYTILTAKVTSIANGMLVPLGPIIGNLLLEKNDAKNSQILRAYTLVRFFIASLIVVPLFVVFEDLISWWIGEKYVLPTIVKYLLLCDFFINIYYTACCDFIGAAGLFNKDKYIALLGAVINIMLSITLVCRLGVTGVLIGTIVSQLFFWISRSALLFRHCVKQGIKAFLLYWLRVLFHVSVLCCTIFICDYIYSWMDISIGVCQVMLGALEAVLLTVVIFLTVFGWSSEFQYLKCNFIKR